MSTHHDVVVVGGGPAGSTAATLAAMDGARVLLLDKDTHPRWRIGESLLPATIHGICRLLGAADEIGRAGFVPKRGGTFKWGRSTEPWTFEFGLSRRTTVDTAHAYQVRRNTFDAILLDNARRHGVEVREQHTAASVVFDSEGRVCGVRYRDDQRRSGTVHARWVVDASGAGSRLHPALGGDRQLDPQFRHVALFGYYSGGRRLPAPSSGNIFCVAFKDGWFWYIPLSEDGTLTSVGAVVHRDHADAIQGDPETAMRELIARCPEIAELLADATRETMPPYDRLRVRRDYSYTRPRFWRPGLVAVGDAACFLDPVFSSGVHLGTYGALCAARAINATRAGEVSEYTAFSEFQHRYASEYQRWRDFLVAFYATHRDPGSYFWAAREAFAAEEDMSAAEAFATLVGGVAIGAHDTTIGDLHNADDLVGSPLVADVMAEGAVLQAQAAGLAPPPLPERPDGLVPSPDGLRWQATDTTELAVR